MNRYSIPLNVESYVQSRRKPSDPFTRDWPMVDEEETDPALPEDDESLPPPPRPKSGPTGTPVAEERAGLRSPEELEEKARRARALDSFGNAMSGIKTYASLGRKGLAEFGGNIRPPSGEEAQALEQQAKGARLEEQDELRPEERAMLESLGLTVPEGVRGSQVRHLIPSINRQQTTPYQQESIEQRKSEATSRDAHRAAILAQGDERIEATKANRARDEANKTESEDRSIATDFARRPEVQEVRKTITDYADVKSALQNPNPTNDQAVLNFLPRLMGEVGNLSVSDREAAARRMGWLNQFTDWASQGVRAKFTDERRKQMLDLADFMNESHEKVLDRAAKEHSGTYGAIYKNRTQDQIFGMLRPGRQGKGTTQGGQQNATSGGAPAKKYRIPRSRTDAIEEAQRRGVEFEVIDG